MEESWGEIQEYLAEVFNWAGLDAIEAEELAVLPGLDEVFTLSDIKTYADSGESDVLVVDCAPTAETIRLLSLPDILAWYMDRLFPMSRRVNRHLGPVLSRGHELPVAGDDVFAAGAASTTASTASRRSSPTPALTSVRLVVNPERMVIAEARRTYTYLSLFGYRVDAVVANRLLPDDITDPWFDRGRRPTPSISPRSTSFAPLPVLRAELAADEPVGLDRLRASAAASTATPTRRRCSTTASPAHHRRRRLPLTLELPFADHDDLDVGRQGDELLVRIGPYRRAMATARLTAPAGDHRRHVPDGETEGRIRWRTRRSR